MEDNIRIEISVTNQGKKQIIIEKKYKFNFSNKKKDNSKIIEYENLHNHFKKEYEASKSIHIFNEISQDMGLICPEFNSIRTQIIRSQNKQLLSDITTFEEIPEESEYYKTENDLFADVFITRAYVEKINSFYTTSISILKDKKQSTYETLFKETKKNESKFSNSIVISPINFHCDFKKGISNANSFNNYLKNLFQKNPTFYKLIIALKKEEDLSIDEIKALFECYKNKEEKIICIGCDDDDQQSDIYFYLVLASSHGNLNYRKTLTECIKQALCFKILLKEIFNQGIKFIIMVDNKACIAIAQDTNSKGRCKHIDIRYKLIQEKIMKN
ncbi:hypothetical protein H8356DRAFT_1361944 [Neocallimastix lanati (nom. inval.)]|nr:hypothetical protein H8356DRAFT_1361944 [Neocallimastix sp. JGI-2020a]